MRRGVQVARRAWPRATPAAAGSKHFASHDASGFLSKSLRLPDRVPQDSIDAVHAMLQSGYIYRYNPSPGSVPEASLAELEFAECVGAKYAIGCNSGGSGIFLALHAVGVKPGDEVLCNALSFTAAPSAIALANAVPVLVDASPDMTMDLDDLEEKITPGQTKFLLLTHSASPAPRENLHADVVGAFF
jgi:dTDP-4-amino-4,6-dideoxygalactose transaminase